MFRRHGLAVWAAGLILTASARAGEDGTGLPLFGATVAMDRPGCVTLVVEDHGGNRVRNLVSETPLARGKHTIWWDGTRDPTPAELAEARGGDLPREWVRPGRYRVRGVVRDPIVPRYEFPFYSSGYPPWPTADGLGGWLADNSPPRSVLFLPGDEGAKRPARVYVGSARNENGYGLAWMDPEGTKLGGRRWVGGNWTGAAALARDGGDRPAEGHDLYAASVTLRGDRPEARVVGLKLNGEEELLTVRPLEAPAGGYGATPPMEVWAVGGMAVRNGVAVLSFPGGNQLQFYDLRKKAFLGEVAVPDPRGLLFDGEGRLWMVSQGQVLRYASAFSPASLPRPQPVIRVGLDEPRQLAMDADDRIYVSCHGRSHQVKVFSDTGRLVATVGKPGVPGVGPYDSQRMNQPEGLAVDDQGRLWVAECDFLPKRVGVWNTEGRLLKSYYGPPKPGGGGSLDPVDRSRLYYASENQGTMVFRINWTNGGTEPAEILYRPDPAGSWLRSGTNAIAAPETALYREGRRYATNTFNSSPFGGAAVGLIFVERDGTLRPAAAMGLANGWPVVANAAFAARWPRPERPGQPRPMTYFLWSDLNGDGLVDPGETVFTVGAAGGVTVMSDLSFCASYLDGRAVRLAPTGFTPDGVPLYDRARMEILLTDVPGPKALDNNQAMAWPDHWVTLVTASDSATGQVVRGAFAGGGNHWTYPYVGPGGAHGPAVENAGNAPRGVLGPTGRVLGVSTGTGKTSSGEVWGLHGRNGVVYLFTTDGLMVATLFADARTGKHWDEFPARRGVELPGLTLGRDSLWPTLGRTEEGFLYLVGVPWGGIVRLEGLETLNRLPAQEIEVSEAGLAKAKAWLGGR